MASCDPLFAWNSQLDDYAMPREEPQVSSYYSRNILKYNENYASVRTSPNIPKTPSPLSHEVEIEIEKPIDQIHPCWGKECNVIINSSLYFCPACAAKYSPKK